MSVYKETARPLIIKPPKIRVAPVTIVGTAPYVQHKFSQKVRLKMRATHEAGSRARSKRTKEARDFEADYRAATYVSVDGWHGIPASAFRSAMISACRLVQFKMTVAKCSIFVLADGIDEDGTPLVKIEGEPRMHIAPVRNESGVVDLRSRPIWMSWRAQPRIQWDEDQFSANDVFNLLARAGVQVGVGEGRPDSKDSNGMSWGTFALENGGAVDEETTLGE